MKVFTVRSRIVELIDSLKVLINCLRSCHVVAIIGMLELVRATRPM